MSYSFNEIETLAKRATRGFGLSWGVAEDCAKIIRFLSENSYDGVLALSLIFQSTAGHPSIDASLLFLDRSSQIAEGGYAQQKHVHTLFFCGAVGVAARHHDLNLRIMNAEFQGVTDGVNFEISEGFPEISGMVRVEITPQKPGKTRVARADPNMDAYSFLARLADKTFAPISEESRALGAGGDESDNSRRSLHKST